MNYLGIDYGEKRIGLSYGDDDVYLAVPITAAVQNRFEERMAYIGEQIRSRRVGELVVGYPYNMDGTIGFKAREVDAFIDKLTARFALPVHRTDERLTSSDAQARMQEAGGSARSRSKKSIQAKLAERRSGTLDSRAATLILQDYLDTLPRPDAGLLFPENDAADSAYDACAGDDTTHGDSNADRSDAENILTGGLDSDNAAGADNTLGTDNAAGADNALGTDDAAETDNALGTDGEDTADRLSGTNFSDDLPAKPLGKQGRKGRKDHDKGRREDRRHW